MMKSSDVDSFFDVMFTPEVHYDGQCNSRYYLCPSSGSYNELDFSFFIDLRNKINYLNIKIITLRARKNSPLYWKPAVILTIIVGDMELSGLLPGTIKLVGEGGKPNALATFGVLKSSIWSLNIIPVDFDRINAPSL